MSSVSFLLKSKEYCLKNTENNSNFKRETMFQCSCSSEGKSVVLYMFDLAQHVDLNFKYFYVICINIQVLFILICITYLKKNNT